MEDELKRIAPSPPAANDPAFTEYSVVKKILDAATEAITKTKTASTDAANDYRNADNAMKTIASATPTDVTKAKDDISNALADIKNKEIEIDNVLNALKGKGSEALEKLALKYDATRKSSPEIPKPEFKIQPPPYEPDFPPLPPLQPSIPHLAQPPFEAPAPLPSPASPPNYPVASTTNNVGYSYPFDADIYPQPAEGDAASDCLNRLSWCKDAALRAQMDGECAGTCGREDRGDDHGSNCDAMVDLCKEPTYEMMMNIYCQDTCNM